MTKKKVLVLKQRIPPKLKAMMDEEPIFTIAGPTQIGRTSTKGEWFVPGRRDAPKEFSQMDAVIKVIGEKGVSRVHAGIVPDDEGGFYITDMNSANWTKVNGRNINPTHRDSTRVRLGVGDEIDCGELLLYVDAIKDADTNHHAFFVGNAGYNLGGVKNDLESLEAALEKRGFKDNIKKLYNGEATRRNVRAYLDQVAYLTDPDSHFIFFYSGHGTKEGLALAIGEDCSPRSLFLKPRDFYSRLSNVRGKKAVILDCCHAGVFASQEIMPEVPPDTLVIAATDENGGAYETRFYDDNGQKQRMGKLTKFIVEYFSTHRGELNLADLRDALEEKMVHVGKFGDIRYQQPVVGGNGSFTIMVANTDSSRF